MITDPSGLRKPCASEIPELDTSWLSLYYTMFNAIVPGDQEIGGPIVERLPLTPHGTYE